MSSPEMVFSRASYPAFTITTNRETGILQAVRKIFISGNFSSGHGFSFVDAPVRFFSVSKEKMLCRRLFGGPFPSLANRFSLWRGQMLLDYGCCRLRTFAPETAGKVCFRHLCGCARPVEPLTQK